MVDCIKLEGDVFTQYDSFKPTIVLECLDPDAHEDFKMKYRTCLLIT
jgi:hypothetical protein